jgi:hypothetical protein
MSGAIHPLPQYAFMVWCLVKSTGTTLPLPLPLNVQISFLVTSPKITKDITHGMDVCPRFSVLCCPLSVEALRWTDSPTKESYQMSIGSRSPLRKA